MSPETSFYIFLADAPPEEPPPGWNIICAEELGLEDLAQQTYRYSLMEFATAIKPSCFKHLLEKQDYEAAIYLDPDIQLFSSLEKVSRALREGASMVLTPHLLAPLRDEKSPTDLDILQSGTFNLGFAAIRACEEARLFLDWWEERLSQQCYNDLRRGMFVDQKWVDFAPSFMGGLHILRDPGYNVAYWNLLHRPVEKSGSSWRVGEFALTFFHFSGVVPGEPGIFSKHQTRFSINNVGPVKILVSKYLDQLKQNDHASWANVPYAFGHHEDGSAVPDVIRRFPPTEKSALNWWKGLDTAFWNSPSACVDQEHGYEITRLMLAVYESRPDIQSKFPLSLQSGRRMFHDWFVAYGADEHRVAEVHWNASLPRRGRRVSLWRRFRARLRVAIAGLTAK